MKTAEEKANEILHELNFNKELTTTEIVAKGLKEYFAQHHCEGAPQPTAKVVAVVPMSEFTAHMEAPAEKESMKTKIFQALGTASMCWSETPTGVFDDITAKALGNQLVLAHEQEVIDVVSSIVDELSLCQQCLTAHQKIIQAIPSRFWESKVAEDFFTLDELLNILALSKDSLNAMERLNEFYEKRKA